MSRVRFAKIATPAAAPAGKVEIFVDTADGLTKQIDESGVVKNLALATAPLPLSYLDTDGTLAANSDTRVPSQKAVKTYVDTGLATKQASLGFTAENVANKDTDGTLSANSDTKYPSQKATKTYVDTAITSRVMFIGTADTTSTPSSYADITPTGVGSMTLPANFWKVGRAIRIKVQGLLTYGDGEGQIDVLISTIPSNPPASVQYTLASVAAISQVTLIDLDIILVCRSIGSSGHIQGSMTLQIDTVDPVSGSEGGPKYGAINVNSTLVTCNTTTSADLGVFYSSNGDVLQLQNMVVELLN